MRIFLLGMSGIGMQGLAILAKKQNYEVSGFDDNQKIEYLEKAGINYSNTIPDNTDFVVFSSAIQPNHPLIQFATEHEIPCINRTDFLLNHLQFNPNKILVAGAHGKTTTSSFIAYILNMESYLVGGIINGEKAPADHKCGVYSVIETDESDGSFTKWSQKKPTTNAKIYKILTTFDFEHMDYFKTEENCTKAFQKYILDNFHESFVIIEKDAFEKLDIANKLLEIGIYPTSATNLKTFASQKYCQENDTTADYVFNHLEFKENGLQFQINGNAVEIPLLGEHNASNFTAIYALQEALEIPYENVREKIAQFPGIKKRMQKITQKNDFTIYSDYGHHPKEVSAVINAFTLHKKHKPDVVIEMHRYTRLKYTWDQWPQALSGCKVFLTALHTASEMPIPGISIEELIKYLKQNNIDVEFLSNINEFVPTNDTICFSAGNLSSTLDKWK